jgi:prevent-host-death family protein
MRTFTAADAKNRFGELLDAARREPVSIERHGRPVAVMISHEEYAAYADAYDALLRDRIKQAEDDVRQGDVVDGETFFSALRARLNRGAA